MAKIKWKYGSDTDDLLTAVEDAICSVRSAMDEMEGMGELQDIYEALADTLVDLENVQEATEAQMSGEYNQQIAEMTREYYRSVI